MTAMKSIQSVILSILASSVLILTPAAYGQSQTPNPPAESASVEEVKSKPRKQAKDHDPWVERMGVSIGLISVILGIGLGAFGIWADYRKRHELIQSIHRERMAALDKGLEPSPLPVELLSGQVSKPHSPGDYLKPGIIWLMVGLGLGIFLYLQKPAGTKFAVGVIPTFVGLGYLLCHWMECRRGKKD